jgi:serine/threonine protein kinase
MVWANGTKILNNSYEIIEVLGMGSFGLTYRARQCLLDSEVVIKTPNPLLKNRPNFDKFVARFLQEGRQLDNLRQLNHPNIVSILGLFAEQDQYCLVMDYVAGTSLEELVKPNRPLSEADAIRYIQDIGKALEAMHGIGTIHRDVHPGNIVLRRKNSQPILIDFGLATEIAEDVGSYDHFSHKIFAPYEQSLGDGRKTVDVYALTATFSFLVTGQKPTPAGMRQLGQPLNLPNRVSERVRVAINKGMEMSPDRRAQSVREWLAMLKPPKVELRSAKGIDYRELEKLLKAKEWRSADELTAKVMLKVMLKVVNREKEGWLKPGYEHIEAFPCEDLRTIDQLWVHYSDSKFGFSIQKKLWLECGGEIGKYNFQVFTKFAAKVGWYHPQNDNWRTYTEFMNDTKNAQNALPASLPLWLHRYVLVWFLVDGGEDVGRIFSRAETCEL